MSTPLRWALIAVVGATLLVAALSRQPAGAFTEETDSGRELDEGLPPRVRAGSEHRWQANTHGGDYKRIHRFWRNYKAPRSRAEPRKRAKEYLDTD